MASESQQWAGDQAQNRSVFEISMGSPHVSTQIEKIERKIENFHAQFDMILQKISAPVQQVAVQQPAARGHPNLKWGSEQQVKPPFPPPIQQPAAPTKASWEIAIDKLADATRISIEQSNQNLQKIQQTINQNMQNMQASITNLERQFGQLAGNITEREKEKFPSQTVPNPRGTSDCNAVRALRSGKSYNNCAKEKIDDKDKAVKINNPVSESLSGQNLNSPEPAPVQKSERIYDPHLPYPERLQPQLKDQQLRDFMQTLANVQINLPLLDAKIPSYAKFLKDVCTHKRKLMDYEKVILTEQCSAVLLHKLPPKRKDPGSFTISCTIGNSNFKRALIDLGASINLMPYSVFQWLGQGELNHTSVILQLADWSIANPRGIIEDLIIKVNNLYLPTDFVVLDMDEDLQTPIILGRPFMATTRTLIDVEAGTLTLRVQDQSVVFNLFDAAKQPAEKLDYIKGISPAICMHKILMEEGIKPTVDAQRCLNPIMKEVVQTEVMNLTPVVPKRTGVTVVKNDNNELIPTRLTTGWRMGVDYRKPNSAITKDHFPLPFIDQMLERLVGRAFYCFLDGSSGYNQIPIAPEDQEKTTFTCPFGTFAYRWMPFGLCNAPATFQRCMMSIFFGLVEQIVEVFMDDFSVFGDSFDQCLQNLSLVLQRCEETNLVLNWEKCHFMVKQGIVLGHLVSRKGIEVDKAKIDVITKLPPPITVKSCLEAFNKLKTLLTSTYIIAAPEWSLPFKLMCDASDYAIGAVLVQRKGKFPHVIYYASRTLNDAQLNYATTEKELLAVVFALKKFRSYLVGAKVIIYTDHATLKYLLSKKDAKPSLIRRVLLLQEFDLEIKDKKGSENVVVDYLSRLILPTTTEEDSLPLSESFLDEQLYAVHNNIPWFVGLVNYLAKRVLLPDFSFQQKKKF
ncbi:uncharacterized protein [Pyrus communis]|uniref:uncharacterized protein n=1 Tax=Pyrus communis TaxID=23211 RepID=UPI0035C037AE